MSNGQEHKASQGVVPQSLDVNISVPASTVKGVLHSALDVRDAADQLHRDIEAAYAEHTPLELRT